MNSTIVPRYVAFYGIIISMEFIHALRLKSWRELFNKYMVYLWLSYLLSGIYLLCYRSASQYPSSLMVISIIVEWCLAVMASVFLCIYLLFRWLLLFAEFIRNERYYLAMRQLREKPVIVLCIIGLVVFFASLDHILRIWFWWGITANATP